ncbi:hypothetical protein QA601_12110 [Chitinispirillales bacterium ANBcel5]|uniref:hypothetical protein n=1 Tax=Cellulosispirillum alkaliphilum TaxID=3039283 RepID=UPI002A571963|nr:hypothetical protein [Chitinispirillales bacterium ANBcel5]
MFISKKTVIVVLLALFQTAVSQTVLTVAKDGSEMYTSVSAALHDAGRDFIIEIRDDAVYEEQVTIGREHSGLTLRSRNQRSKPVIKYTDVTNVGPRNAQEAQIDSLITFDKNGALRILNASNITIDGIIVDGGGAEPFGYDNIWNPGGHPLFHGNTALCLWNSYNVIVRNSELRNAYFGIAIKDRNEGGIFGNDNPSDIHPERVIPMSGFRMAGNHLIEYNRIHGNSWGIFMESMWDLGSTIRFNKIFDNYHQTPQILATVDGLSGGQEQPGGALLSKDHMLTPLAIYNNTFHNNFLTYGGLWKSGAHHLVFNNIYSRPKFLWSQGYQPGGEYSGSQNLALDPEFVNRMKHCIYSVQYREPTFRTDIHVNTTCHTGGTHIRGATQVNVMNNLQPQSGAYVDVECPNGSNVSVFSDQIMAEGALIASQQEDAAFPSSAQVRWFEIQNHFKSLDPANDHFLEPDWDNPFVAQYIKGGGWPEAGIVKGDGTIADIGAVQYNSKQTVLARIEPNKPVMIDGNGTATLEFTLSTYGGVFENPRVKYIRYVRNLPFPERRALTESNIVSLDVSGAQVKINAPTRIDVPNTPEPGDYAFIELVIEGTDNEGRTVVSDVGFLPYRELNYLIDVDVLDLDGNVLDTVRVGENVRVRLRSMQRNGERFTQPLDTVQVRLSSGNLLYRYPEAGLDPVEELRLPGLTIESVSNVMFTAVPRGGSEMVEATGLWTNPGQHGVTLGFYGSSSVVVLPGDPAEVRFINPPSISVTDTLRTIYPGQPFSTELRVFDHFGNATDIPALVRLESLHPRIGNVEIPVEHNSDNSGNVSFTTMVTQGGEGDLFTLRATLDVNGATDEARLRVGPASDYFRIFYGDTLEYDIGAQLQGYVGQRLPVVIRALGGEDRATVLSYRDTEVEIETSGSIAVFESVDASTQQSSFNLINGELRIWVTGTNVLHNGEITVYPVNDRTILPGTRSEIYFSQKPLLVDYGVVYADSGDGRVNRMEVYYQNDLEEAPDSIKLFWPRKVDGHRRVAVGSDQILINPDNPKHVTAIFRDPFPAAITTYSGDDILGTHFYTTKDPLIRPPLVQVNTFRVKDSVGPMITSGIVHERLSPGVDTLILTFSERLAEGTLLGETLLLTKKEDNRQVVLTVKKVVPFMDAFKVIVEDAGSDAPMKGDLLSFTTEVRDLRAQIHAHENNTPIVLGLKAVPPGVDSAFYYDTNADGVVDQVVLHFNKSVHIEDMNLNLTWFGGNETGLLNASSFAFASDSSSITVNVLNAFNQNVADITHGTMSATIGFEDFGEEVSSLVEDRAAPVITKAMYRPGAILSDGEIARDTLIVTFSEHIEIPHYGKPFSLIAEHNGEIRHYSLDLIHYRERLLEHVFILGDTVPEDFFPAAGDSIYINHVAKVVDLMGNVQDNPQNKRVPLEIGEIPIQITASVGPSPYRWGQEVTLQDGLGEFNGLLFRLDVRARVSEGLNLDAMVTVYDNMGNIVLNTNMEQEQSRSYLTYKWRHPLSNRKGRNVAAGTYLAFFNVVRDGTVRSIPVKFSILK